MHCGRRESRSVIGSPYAVAYSGAQDAAQPAQVVAWLSWCRCTVRVHARSRRRMVVQQQPRQALSPGQRGERGSYPVRTSEAYQSGLPRPRPEEGSFTRRPCRQCDEPSLSPRMHSTDSGRPNILQRCTSEERNDGNSPVVNSALHGCWIRGQRKSYEFLHATRSCRTRRLPLRHR
jgi:hypothetical protein